MKHYIFSEPPDTLQAASTLKFLGPPLRASPNNFNFSAAHPIMFVSSRYKTVGYTVRHGFIEAQGVRIPWSEFRRAVTGESV